MVADLDFISRAEWCDGKLWAHLTVHRWSVRTAKRVAQALAWASDHYKGDIWVADNPAAPNLTKFLRMFRFSPCGEVLCQDGAMRRAWVHKHL